MYYDADMWPFEEERAQRTHLTDGDRPRETRNLAHGTEEPKSFMSGEAPH